MASTAFVRERIDLDHPATWPKAVCAFLAEHHELFLRWETRQGGVSPQMFDRAIVGLANVLQPHEMVGWHCTRLTDQEIEEISRNGMRLPDGTMLGRRIDAVAEAGCLAPDVARLLKSRNQADEENRTGTVWFCFSHRGEVANTELDGSSATGVAKRSTTRMNVTRCCRRLSAALGHRASSKQTCRSQLWLGIVVSSSTSFDDSWLDGAYLDKVRQTMRDGSCVRCQLQMFGASFAFLVRTSLN